MKAKFRDYLRFTENATPPVPASSPLQVPFVSMRSKELDHEIRELTLTLLQASWPHDHQNDDDINKYFSEQIRRAKMLQDRLREAQIGESLAKRLERAETILRMVLVVESRFPVGFIQEVEKYFNIQTQKTNSI